MTFDALDLLGADALEDVRSGSSLLKRGSKGEAVKTVQGLLGADADGDFGSKTEAAVKSFQGAHGLSADGKVGKDTLAALEKSPGVTHVDFTDDEVVTASAPKLAAQGAGAGAGAQSGSKSGALLTWPFGGGSARAEPAPTSTSEAEATKKRNLIIAVGLAVVGAAGLAVAWKR